MESRHLVRTLMDLPILAELPVHARERAAGLLAGISTPVDLRPQEALIHEGALSGASGYVLLDGSVEVSREGATPLRLTAPVLLGEMQQFSPFAQRTATVTALEHGRALRFTWSELYAHADKALSAQDVALLMDGIEACVRERFHTESLERLPLFRGLSPALNLSACLLLLWNARPLRLRKGETLFRAGDMCGATGFLIVAGEVALTAGGKRLRVVPAPDLLGVMPDFDPGLVWTATAEAEDDADLLYFSWQEFMAMLRQRVAPAAFEEFCAAARAAMDRHFSH